MARRVSKEILSLRYLWVQIDNGLDLNYVFRFAFKEIAKRQEEIAKERDLMEKERKLLVKQKPSANSSQNSESTGKPTSEKVIFFFEYMSFSYHVG